MAIDLGRIVDCILAREGGYVDHPEDRGGPTKWGITIATLRDARDNDALTSRDVAALTEEEAREIYLSEYAMPFAWVTSQRIAELAIDAAVQHGFGNAVKLLQRAVGETPDGLAGPRTRHAVAMADPDQLWRSLFGERLRFYAALVQRAPAQRVFAAGWINRMAELCQ